MILNIVQGSGIQEGWTVLFIVSVNLNFIFNRDLADNQEIQVKGGHHTPQLPVDIFPKHNNDSGDNQH